MSDTLVVAQRDLLGTRNMRRLRHSGQIPANLYGHGYENVHLQLPAEQILAALRHGGKVVTLDGAVQDTALIREVQWDAFGTQILHVDLTRVSASETVEVRVEIVLRGESPGSKQGGVLHQHLREVAIRCPVAVIPDRFDININHLEIGGTVTAGDLPLPSGATLEIPAETLIIECAAAKEYVEEEAGAGEAIEPELIGRKLKEEEEEEE
jgi:large subunit ribosomal protein L25